MGTYREQDPLVTFLKAQQSRVVDCLMRFAHGEGAAMLVEARRRIRALAEVEAQVLYPVFARVALRPEAQRLLDDSRDNRARHLAALDALAHKRAPRVRTLAAVELKDHIEHHGEQHALFLIAALSSQLPRPVYRSIASTVMARHDRELEAGRPAEPRRQRTLASNA